MQNNEIQNKVVPPATPQPKRSRADVVIYILTWLFRIAVGVTFIFSGTAKAIDPWGSIYKMHDYISAMPEGLLSWALPLLTPVSFVLFTVELLLGVALITGSYRRLAPIGTLFIMLIMLPLTLWIALKNPVADCGCFGDALLLTNWQTFWKNVVLTAMAVWLIIFNKRARCLILPTLQWLMFAGSVIFSVAIGFIGYSIQPMIDFRPYHVGDTIIDYSENEGYVDPETSQMQAVWSNGNETITIPADSIPDGEDWEFVDRITAEGNNEEKAKQENKGLAIFDGAEDITEEIISTEGEQIVVFMTDLPHLSSGNFYKLNSLYTYCNAHDVSMITVAAASPLQINDFIDHSLAEYPIYTAEDTAIKEVVRGNPAVVYLKDGKIVWKSSLSAIPTYDFMESTPDTPGALADYAPFTDKNMFDTICLIFISYIALIILLSHIPMVIRFTSSKIKKSRWVKDGAVVKSLIITALSIMTFSCHKDEPSDKSTQESTERTILIYMVATNSLSSDASNDINEILEGYGKTIDSKTKILIYETVPYEPSPVLYEVVKSKDGSTHLNILKNYSTEQSSVSKSRITEVINDMKNIAPAEEYGLFLWSHASGWLPTGTPAGMPPRSYSPVFRTFGDDYGKSISITALAEVIPQDTFEFIWMDCCLMGGIEVVYQLRNHCDKMVVYPTEILAGGAPYDLVIPYLAGEDLELEKAAEATYDYYANKNDIRYRSCTVSVVETKYLDEVAACARNVVNTGVTDIPVNQLQVYGILRGVKFYDFLQTYQAIANNQETSSRLVAATEKAVIFKRATPRFLEYTIDPAHFSGLSCFPVNAAAPQSFLEYYHTLDWYRDVYL